ncbi:hypothetical protein ALC53_11978, partial [Atta colombica]
QKKIIIVVNFQQIFHKTNSLPFTNILKHFEIFSPKLSSRQNCLAISIRRHEKSTNCVSRELRLQRFCFATYVLYLKSFGLSRFVCFSRVIWNLEELKNFDKYFLGFQDSVLRLTIAQLNVIFVNCGAHVFAIFDVRDSVGARNTIH